MNGPDTPFQSGLDHGDGGAPSGGGFPRGDQFRSLLEMAPDAILIVATDGTIVFANSQAVNWFGYTLAELLGRSVETLVPDSFRSQHKHLREGYNAAPRQRPMGAGLDLHVRCKDGHELPVEISLGPLQTEEGMLVTAIVRDVSARREAERRINELNTRLELRALELEAINRELEAFSYSVSHDLRAPLRAIDGFSKALLEDYGDQLDDAAGNYLTRIRAGTQRMAQLIDDLLHLSRISRVELVPTTVDLSALAAEVAAALRAEAPERVVEFAIQPGLQAQGDSHLLRVALENLLGNAWKFTSGKAAGRIGFGAFEQDGGTVYFVRDDGAGFDMSYVDKLFGAFQRLHGANEFPGTGIGLATVKRIVARHGGRVWAEGAVDGGATFYFTLQPNGGEHGQRQEHPAG